MVQTFLVEETKELIYDSDKINEWKAKCEELGLTKQIALATGDKSPCPFEFMNTVSLRVYENICPAMVNYRDYNKTAIPLEVLSLIALSEKEKYFSKIEIWYDDKSPDPIAVGIIKKAEWDYDRYLIARWGDAIRPFEELKDLAVERFKKSSLLTLRKKISDAEECIKNLELNAELYFNAQAENYNVIGF